MIHHHFSGNWEREREKLLEELNDGRRRNWSIVGFNVWGRNDLNDRLISDDRSQMQWKGRREKKKKVFDNSLNRDQSVKVYSATTTVNQNEAAADELFLKLFNHLLLTIPVPLQFVVVVFFNIYLLAIKELCNIKKRG